jgi:hypothetical protein
MIRKAFLLFSFLTFVSSITSPQDLPIYANLRACVQYALGGPGIPCFFNYCDLFSGIGCQSYICACNQFSESRNEVSSLASKSCGTSSDIATATSIWKEFCLQLLATTPSVPLTPTIHPTQCTILLFETDRSEFLHRQRHHDDRRQWPTSHHDATISCGSKYRH